MVSSSEKTVSAYLQSLAPERRAVIQTVRQLVSSSLPSGFEECMQYGMIAWVVPTSTYDQPTYNGQPIAVCSLAAQKNAYSLYLMGCYGDGSVMKALEGAYKSAGKRLDMGKSCLRFKKVDDLVHDAVAQALGATSVDDMIALHEAARGHRVKKTTPKKAATKSAATKSAAKKPAAKKATTKKPAAKKATKKKATAKKTEA